MQEPRIGNLIVADDDAATLTLLRRHLENAGYDVIACKNGREALSAIRAQGGGLVLADWDMPEMNGLELCRAIKAEIGCGELSFAFILLLTANSETHQIVSGLEAGADDYLTKPFNKLELLARLRAGERICKLNARLLQSSEKLKLLNAKLERLANSDGLTAIANRRHFFERCAECWSLLERHGGRAGLILFDIDRFKQVNDTYGHQAGDAVLIEVARLSKLALRQHDLIGRVGGEEFCILARETDRVGLQEVAERVRRAIEQHSFTFEQRDITVTISLGCACRSDRHETVDTLYRLADDLLYKAKQNGRNQVWECDEHGQPRRITPVPADQNRDYQAATM